MPRYVVEVELVTTGRCEIVADSEDEALDKADQMGTNNCYHVSREETSYACVLGTVEEVARMKRQAKILAEQRRTE